MAKNEALNSLYSMMHKNLFPRADTSRSNNDIVNGLASGYNFMGTVMEGIRERNDRNRLQKLLSGVYGEDNNGQQQTQPQAGQSITVGDIPNNNSFGSVLGDRSATPVVNQQQEPDYSVKGFMRKALDSGMLPSNAMAAYSSFIAPMEQDIRNRNVWDAMKALARRNQGQGLSDQEYYDIMAKLNYNTGEDYALKDNNAIIDQMVKVQNGLLQPIGAMHDPEKYRRIGYPIKLDMWDALKPTIGVNSTNYGNYGMGFNNSTAGSEYGGDNENARAIYNYFKNKGYSDNVIAAIMGNIKAESQFNPTIGYGDGGTSGGLAQWHDEQPGVGRLSNLKNFAVNRQMDWKDLNTQLDFMVDEINKNYPNLIQQMSNLSPNEAAILFHDTYERSRDNAEQKARRGTYADEIYNGRRSGGNIGTYNMPTQGANIDEQVKQLKPELQQVLPTIGGILKNKFGVDGVISSGARNAEHNRQVGGAERSYHIGGDAVDIVLPDSTTPEQYKQIEDYFKSTGQFAEVDNHDKGSGFHLHLGGYKGGNIGNTGGGYSYQPQQRPSFANAFNPQVVSGQGAILNPMVLYKAVTEQAENQRLQDNANRQFNYTMFKDQRDYELNKERFNLLKWQAEQQAKQAKAGKLKDVNIFTRDELDSPDSPIGKFISSLSNTDEFGNPSISKSELEANSTAIAENCASKYLKLIEDGYSEEEAKSILKANLQNAIGESLIAYGKGDANQKKLSANQAINNIYRNAVMIAKNKSNNSEVNDRSNFASRTGTFKIKDNYENITNNGKGVEGLTLKGQQEARAKRDEEKDKYGDIGSWSIPSDEVLNDPNFYVQDGQYSYDPQLAKRMMEHGFTDDDIKVFLQLYKLHPVYWSIYKPAIEENNIAKLKELKDKLQDIKINENTFKKAKRNDFVKSFSPVLGTRLIGNFF